MAKITPQVSLVDYLGKVSEDILAVFSLVVEGVYFEICYAYDQDSFHLTLSEELENYLSVKGLEIDRDELLGQIQKVALPWDQVINIVNDWDPLSITGEQNTREGEEISPDQVKPLS